MQRFSLIDYPGRICAIVFTRGCNFRCPYCHNPELVLPDAAESRVPENEFFSLLEKRRGKLDGVSITGGEPLLQPGMIPFVRQIKELGYCVKLDTNGSRPDILEEMIAERLLDFIAMDIKAPLEKYQDVVRSPVDTRQINRSISSIIRSGVDYEFRTTIVRSLLSEKDLLEIGRKIEGSERYVLQKFLPAKTLDPSFLKDSCYSDEELQGIKKSLEKYIQSVYIR
ncbi:MAG: anaerobic ribonucleoside-triphosphate reductase activating protein [Syntrophales bacterium]